VLRKDWMFKLVGAEQFTIGRANCCITIEATEGFMYQYSLEVNGKTLEKFSENQSKIMKTWLCNVSGMPFRIVLGTTTNLLCLANWLQNTIRCSLLKLSTAVGERIQWQYC